MSLSHESGLWLSRILPATSIVLALFLAAIPWLWAAHSIPVIMVSWIGIYYWSLFRPHSLSYFFIFVIGLLQDILSGLPLGGSSFLLLCLNSAVLRLRGCISTQHFAAIWIAFFLLALLLSLGQSLILSVTTNQSMFAYLTPSALSLMLTCFAYPVAHLLLNRLYSIMPSMHRNSPAL